MRVLSMVLMMTRRHGMQSQLRAGSQRFVPGNLSADCPFLFDCIKLATGPVIYIPENVSNPRTVKRLWPWFHLAIVAQLTSKILPSPHPRESALPTPGALLPDRGGEK